MKKSPLFNIIAISIISIVVLWVIQTMIVGSGNGLSINTAGNLGGNFGGENFRGGMNMGNNYFYGGTTTYILLILIKILFALFVVSLVVGLILWVKNNIFTAEEREAIKNTFTINKPVVKKDVCSICEKQLNNEWKVCPYCGKIKLAPDNKTDNK